jgi:1,4-alpha-glucan branching enzyme
MGCCRSFSSNRVAQRAQVLIGRDVHVELFGEEVTGFWLPGCGYALWFGINSTGSESSLVRSRRTRVALWNTAPMRLHLRSLLHTSRASFARDPHASRQVWSAQGGYPGDRAHWDSYRDIGFDLPIEQLGSIARETRKFSSIKYHRVTGSREEKQLYDRTAAKNVAEQHAIHFLEQYRQQIREISEVGFDPIIVAPFDAELLGHWWFERPIFLEEFIRYAASERNFPLTMPN